MRWLFPLTLALGLVATSAEAQPRSRTHVVREGDTLQAIARRYRVSADALMAENRLRRTRIRPGDTLRIPTREEEARRSVPAVRYTVRQGDRLARLARRFRVSVEDIQQANELRSTDLRPGEQLWIPRPGHTGAEIRERLRTGNPVVAPDVPPELEEDESQAVAARARDLGLGSMAVGQRLLHQPPDPRWVEAAGDPEAIEGTLLQPVTEGRFLRGWGSGEEGYHLAIDIGANTGTPIHAAERGLVAYVGRGIRGYGNLVIVVHANEWVTAYAHNHQNMVVPGQLVERGQVIATVGSTGFAQGPHLHFFFVHQGRHCDPMPLFRPRLERPESQEDGMELVWDAELRPSGIRCLFRAEAPHPHRHWRDDRRPARRGDGAAPARRRR
jgi:murein DD-endopeptidase MepM/ murein hydrolase activator NlpD